MKKTLLIIGFLFSTTAFASIQNIIIDGSIPSKVTLNPKANNSIAANANGNNQKTTTTKDIVLDHITLSAQAKAYLAETASKQLKQFNEHSKQPISLSSEFSSIQLRMNGVPVLDQGRHGTCVTFATSAAIDAAYGKGDYISQLCNLELGSYLHQMNYSYLSGWEGAYVSSILNQIKNYGVISMTSQVFEGCSGVHFYPLSNANDTGNPMSVADFTARSENILSTLSTKSVLKISDAVSPRLDSNAILTSVKQALLSGNRVVFGSMLDRYRGENGAQGQYAYANDSWILTPEIAYDANHGNIDAAHALVITGFDDNAVITGPDNTIHRGVLTLRNSWGFMAGDYGNYYMSYDYFKTFALEVIEVQKKG